MTGIRATLVRSPSGLIDDLGIRATIPMDKNNTTNLSLTRTALGSIQRYQIVMEVGELEVGPPMGVTSTTPLLGMATNVAVTGQVLDVMIVGVVHDPTWTWSVGNLFSDSTGTLSQDGTGGFRRVGSAISPTTILIDMRDGVQNRNTILSGDGPPLDSLGNQGDFYINLTSYDIWGPKSSTWDKKGSLIGPKGPPGASTSNVYPFNSTTFLSLNHQLGHYPSVIIQDSTGEEVWADVHYVDINTLEISFAFPMGGTVILT